jgi:hypothetical protein
MLHDMNETRKDITDWLIHFTKDVNEESTVDIFHEHLDEDNQPYKLLDYSNQLPNGISEFTAFEILKNIVSECGIRYGYSFRKNKTTLYGGDPVICMTEMPLKSFLEYAKTRNSDSIDTYGIAITKNSAYKYGARPVIYGLSQDKFKYIENSQHKRILPSEILPLQEQYRLVSYNPEHKIDWTHEREWRIKKKHEIYNHIYVENGIDLEEIEVLNIFEEDSPCENIILIVNSSSEAEEIFDQVLILQDSGSNNYGNEFLPNSISILVIEKITEKDLNVTKIEDLSNECYFEVKIDKLNPSEIECLKKVINYAKTKLSIEAEKDFHNYTSLKKHKKGYYLDLCGSASIMCNDPKNKYLREMMELGIASSYGEGYFIKAIGNVHKDQSVSYHEFIAERICAFLNKELENIFYTKTYMD